jgi:hypothetical protein
MMIERMIASAERESSKQAARRERSFDAAAMRREREIHDLPRRRSSASNVRPRSRPRAGRVGGEDGREARSTRCSPMTRSRWPVDDDTLPQGVPWDAISADGEIRFSSLSRPTALPVDAPALSALDHSLLFAHLIGASG